MNLNETINFCKEAVEDFEDKVKRSRSNKSKRLNKNTLEFWTGLYKSLRELKELRDLKVCTGCARFNDEVFDSVHLACCPDSNYIPVRQYVKESKYPQEQFPKDKS